MTRSTSSQPVRLWTGPSRAIRTMQAQALARCSGHGAFHHPAHRGVVALGVLRPGETAWDRLQQLLNRIPNPWPTDGWILTMELRCPHCGETRMVEIHQSHKGQRVVCSCCGKDAPHATASPPGPMSGK